MATYNKYYNYPNKELWDDAAWAGRITCMVPLIHWIQAKNLETGNFYMTPGSEKGAPAEHNYRYLPPETEGYWKSRGMLYGHCGLRGVCLIPEKFYDNRDNEPPILLVAAQSKPQSPTRVEDIFTHYNAYNEMAADEYFCPTYVPSDGVDHDGMFIEILQELAALYHMKYRKVYFDVSTVYNNGFRLADIPGFVLRDREGNVMSDPDSKVIEVGSLKIPCLDVTGMWANGDSLTYRLVYRPNASNATFDRERLIHSAVGRAMAEGMLLEHKFNDARDPELIKYWDDMGLKCDFHYLDGEQYITFTPKCAFDEPKKKLPLWVVFQESNDVNPHQAVTAFSYCYGTFDIAATGDCILLYFVLETAEDNDILSDMIKETASRYPVDLSRVYLMGHSHDGGLASYYIRRHPNEIAAVATLGNHPGLISKATFGPQTMAVEDDEVEVMSRTDMPTVNISGMNEMINFFPLHSDATDFRPSNGRNLTHTKDVRIESWQRRLKASRCPMKTYEEIEATKNSRDYVERTLGIPADKTDLLYLDGSENFIADIRNIDGNYHLRMIGLGNMPHTITPLMCELIWSYVRRFKRDQETGEIVELY